MVSRFRVQVCLCHGCTSGLSPSLLYRSCISAKEPSPRTSPTVHYTPATEIRRSLQQWFESFVQSDVSRVPPAMLCQVSQASQCSIQVAFHQVPGGQARRPICKGQPQALSRGIHAGRRWLAHAGEAAFSYHLSPQLPYPSCASLSSALNLAVLRCMVTYQSAPKAGSTIACGRACTAIRVEPPCASPARSHCDQESSSGVCLCRTAGWCTSPSTLKLSRPLRCFAGGMATKKEGAT